MRRPWAFFSIILCGYGCGDTKENTSTAATAEAAQAAPETAPDAAAPSVAPFRGCDDTPALTAIPEGALVGAVDGRPFQARAVVFEHGVGGWVLRIHDAPLTHPTARVVDGQQIELALPEEPTVGWRSERAGGVGNASWTAAQQQNLATRRGTEAWAIEVTDWTRLPWRPDGGVIQDTGRAAGRLAIALRGDGGHCAWIAGRFEGAFVRQIGRPLDDLPQVNQRALMRAPADARRDRADFERRVRLESERAVQGATQGQAKP